MLSRLALVLLVAALTSYALCLLWTVMLELARIAAAGLAVAGG